MDPRKVIKMGSLASGPRENGCDWNSLTCTYTASNGPIFRKVIEMGSLASGPRDRLVTFGNGCKYEGTYHKIKIEQ